MLKVSTVMEIYNYADALSKNIDSVKEQTYRHWEPIMCNDCSMEKCHVKDKN